MECIRKNESKILTSDESSNRNEVEISAMNRTYHLKGAGRQKKETDPTVLQYCLQHIIMSHIIKLMILNIRLIYHLLPHTL